MYVKVGKNIKNTSAKGQFEDVQAITAMIRLSKFVLFISTR